MLLVKIVGHQLICSLLDLSFTIPVKDLGDMGNLIDFLC